MAPRLVGWQRQAERDLDPGPARGDPRRRSTARRCRWLAPAAQTPACTRWRRSASCALPSTLDTDTLQRAFNAQLPPTCACSTVEDVPLAFHARFSATGKTISVRHPANGTSSVPSPPGRAWHVTATAGSGGDAAGRRHLVRHARLLGVPVHRRQRAARDSHRQRWPASPTCRTAAGAAAADAVPDGATLLVFEVSANGFLRHMVRAHGRARWSRSAHGPPRSRSAGPAGVGERARPAPLRRAHGLWLVEVHY